MNYDLGKISVAAYSYPYRTSHLLRSCQMYPNDMLEEAAFSSGHDDNLSRQYWVASNISEFANIIEV